MEKFRRKVYLDSDKEETQSLISDEVINLGNLHPKKCEDLSPVARSPKDQTIECDIQPTDTLQSLSLKYNIQTAELKRVNNILNESEFHALKRIKIPVKPASFLKDLIPGVHSEDNRRENGWYVDHKDASFSSQMSSGVSTGYSSPCSESNTDHAVVPESRDTKKVRKFLKEMDKDLERIKEKQSNQETEDVGEDNTVAEILNNSREEVLYSNFHSAEENGVSNGSLLCWCFLVVLLVLSLLLILMALMSVDHHTGLFQEEENTNASKLSSA